MSKKTSNIDDKYLKTTNCLPFSINNDTPHYLNDETPKKKLT